MEQIVRTAQQLGAALRQRRRQQRITQQSLGDMVRLRQATISKLESGDRGVQLGTLLDALNALELELVIRTRTKSTAAEIGDIF